MPSVIVYLLTNDPKSDSVRKLSGLFTSNMFSIKIIDIGPDIKEDRESENYLQLEESHKVNHCLTDSKDKHRKDHILILKDTSITHVNSEIVEEIIKKAIESSKFHLCYLCKWMDRCDLYTGKKELRKTSILAKTQAPHGIQALLISPEGRDILLGDAPMKNGKKLHSNFTKEKLLSLNLTEFILKGYLDATCIVPNLFDFDINRASKNSDYYKTTECIPPPFDQFGVPPGTSINKFASYFVLIIFILLVIFGLFLVFGR